jgi:hypothetical protein
MKRLLIGIGLLAFTAALSLGAITLITGRAATIGSGTAAPVSDNTSDPIAPALEQGLQDSGIALTSPSKDPNISRSQAIQIAIENMQTQKGSNPTASYTLVTKDQSGVSEGMQPSEYLSMQERPVWIVFFENTTSTRSGPADSPLPETISSQTYVFVDANTGEFLLALEESKGPLTTEGSNATSSTPEPAGTD